MSKDLNWMNGLIEPVNIWADDPVVPTKLRVQFLGKFLEDVIKEITKDRYLTIKQKEDYLNYIVIFIKQYLEHWEKNHPKDYGAQRVLKQGIDIVKHGVFQMRLLNEIKPFKK